MNSRTIGDPADISAIGLGRISIFRPYATPIPDGRGFMVKGIGHFQSLGPACVKTSASTMAKSSS